MNIRPIIFVCKLKVKVSWLHSVQYVNITYNEMPIPVCTLHTVLADYV
jgi:hypothetical protein